MAVFGLGRSGISASLALARGGARVHAWDDDPARRRHAASLGVSLADLYRIEWDFAGLVLSPGVPLSHPAPHPLVARALTSGLEILGDMELFARSRPPARVVGVTGTNGKSTTATLIAHLIRASGLRVQLGGNIGTPVLDLRPLSAEGVYVLELSSFQLDLVRTLVSDVAVLLNVAPDHLERHGGFANYIASKTRIFSRRASSQIAVLGLDDDVCRRIHAELAGRRQRRIVPVAVGRRIAGGVYVTEDGMLTDETGGEAVEVVDLARLRALLGTHNQQNAAAAYGAIRALGLPGDNLMRAFRRFAGLAHRQEAVTRIGKVAFVNDSKATNAPAAARALACFRDIYWIAGGRAKAGGVATLAPLFPRMAHAFLIGESAGAFAQTLEGRVPCTICGDLETAFAAATEKAFAEQRPEPVVLFSPACASLDQFENFEQRGDRFRELVVDEKVRRTPPKKTAPKASADAGKAPPKKAGAKKAPPKTAGAKKAPPKKAGANKAGAGAGKP